MYFIRNGNSVANQRSWIIHDFHSIYGLKAKDLAKSLRNMGDMYRAYDPAMRKYNYALAWAIEQLDRRTIAKRDMERLLKLNQGLNDEQVKIVLIMLGQQYAEHHPIVRYQISQQYCLGV